MSQSFFNLSISSNLSELLLCPPVSPSTGSKPRNVDQMTRKCVPVHSQAKLMMRMRMMIIISSSSSGGSSGGGVTDFGFFQGNFLGV